MMTKLPEKTLAGYPILQRKSSPNGGEIIIAYLTHNRVTPYVVWRMMNDGSCHGGDYCTDLPTVLRAFYNRS